jgi:uncharacterized protein
MKIVIVADTHIHNHNELPSEISNAISHAEAVFHLGDFESMEMVEHFKALPNFHGVSGNHDRGKLKSMLPETDIVEIKGKKIGIVHGHGCVLPLGLQYGLIQRFSGEKMDAILFGHTHIGVSKTIDGTLFFNPGSVIGRFPAEQKSYGILDVNDTISSHIIPMRTETTRNNIVSQACSMVNALSSKKFYYRVTTLY